MEPAVIGMDPHKRGVTIEVMAGGETVLGGGRFGTDVEDYAAMAALRAAVVGRGLVERGAGQGPTPAPGDHRNRHHG
jgi:hypothetical protein